MEALPCSTFIALRTISFILLLSLGYQPSYGFFSFKFAFLYCLFIEVFSIKRHFFNVRSSIQSISIPIGQTLSYLTYLQSCLRYFVPREKQSLEMFASVIKRLWLQRINIHAAALSWGTTLNTDHGICSQTLSMNIAQIQIFQNMILCLWFFF